MKCALWLNRQKVYSAEEIRNNLDIASLCGYFAAGSLVEWLKEHNGEEYAAELEKISPKDPKLSEKLEKVFGGQPVSYKTFGSGIEVKAALPAGSAQIIQSSAFGSARFPALGSAPFGSGKSVARFMTRGSRGIGSFSRYTFSSGLLRIGFARRSGSFGYFGSFNYFGSFGYYGSFGYEWEWEWEQFFARFGSFYSTSFSYGSVRSFLQMIGRNFGSYRFGSRCARYFGSGVYFKYGSGILPGSFRSILSSRIATPDSDEYDRILMECVFGCRLNGYGYGIHNI